ncbi:hypothetical protein AGMMS50256_21580 [Betaproteobacteria bacterium]|nr:hypothetical protein AGMMS50256_21580 [Betaproteobacteria bacterium]
MKKLILVLAVMVFTGEASSSALRDGQSSLVLDLDGDGVEVIQIVSGARSQILFDHDADGIRMGTAWVKADDGLLVFDRNGRGHIDSGRELLGNNSVLANGLLAADGYAALADLDSNGDGQITSQDANYKNLYIWRDLDQNGISGPGELQSLMDAGITRIGLARTGNTRTLADETKLEGIGSFTINGQERAYSDVWFAKNGFYREFTDAIPLTDEARTLPDMRGSGMVRDLREAASLDGRLAKDYAAFSRLPRAEFMARLDDFIARWAETSTMQTSFQQANNQGYTLVYLPAGMTETDYFATLWNDAKDIGQIEKKQRHFTQLINILERFNAQTWGDVGARGVRSGAGVSYGIRKLPNGEAYVFFPFHPEQQVMIEKSYDQLKDSVYRGLSPRRAGWV